MKLMGCGLLFAGWLIVLSSLAMLPRFGQRVGFVLAGVMVEAVGIGLTALAYRARVRRR